MTRTNRLVTTWRVIASVGVALMAIFLMTASTVRAADHADAPGVKNDPAADITDVYAFRSPETNDNLVVALNVNPLTAPAMNASTMFADDVSYNIHVDNTGDFVADAVVAAPPLAFSHHAGRPRKPSRPGM